MAQSQQTLKVLLVGAPQGSALASCFETLGWTLEYHTLTGWLSALPLPLPAVRGYDVSVVDMTGTPSMDSWLQVHHAAPRIPHPVVLVVDGPVPPAFHYPRPGGPRIALLAAGSETDVVRSTIDLVCEVYKLVRQGDLATEEVREAERREVLLRSVDQIQLELELVRSLLDSPEEPTATAAQSLRPREVEVYSLLMKGLSIVEMADRLCISESTVKKHIHSIYRKKGVSSRAELMASG